MKMRRDRRFLVGTGSMSSEHRFQRDFRRIQRFRASLASDGAYIKLEMRFVHGRSLLAPLENMARGHPGFKLRRIPILRWW